MDILGTTEFSEEPSKVITLGESSELGDVVEPHVDQSTDSGPSQGVEKLGGALADKVRQFRAGTVIAPRPAETMGLR